jgi:hypothetical protein
MILMVRSAAAPRVSNHAARKTKRLLHIRPSPAWWY